MTEVQAVLSAFLSSEAGIALQAVLLVAFADFVTGVFAAVRDGTFAWGALAAWLRKHIAGRVAPIGVLLALGYFGGASGHLFLAGAVAAAAAYGAETLASIWGNVNPPKEADVKAAANPLNPVPEA